MFVLMWGIASLLIGMAGILGIIILAATVIMFITVFIYELITNFLK